MGTKTNYSPTFPQYPAGAVAITPSDSADLANVSVVFAGVGGNIKVTTANNDVVTFTGVVAGSVLPVQVRRVWSTSTTASSLIGVY